MTWAPLILGLALSSPSPLERAAICYENLDYSCAEAAVSEALGGTLSRAERLEAWRYEALLSIAWRDLERARRAVRAMYAIQANYQPIDLPPDLLALFDEERPPPAPEPEYVDGRYVLQLPADAERDARWWSMGHGLGLGPLSWVLRVIIFPAYWAMSLILPMTLILESTPFTCGAWDSGGERGGHGGLLTSRQDHPSA